MQKKKHIQNISVKICNYKTYILPICKTYMMKTDSLITTLFYI